MAPIACMLTRLRVEPAAPLIALKKGKVDIAYALNCDIGRAALHNPQLTLAQAIGQEIPWRTHSLFPALKIALA